MNVTQIIFCPKCRKYFGATKMTPMGRFLPIREGTGLPLGTIIQSVCSNCEKQTKNTNKILQFAE